MPPTNCARSIRLRSSLAPFIRSVFLFATFYGVYPWKLQSETWKWTLENWWQTTSCLPCMKMRSELEAYFGIPFPLFDVTIYCSVAFVRTREVNKVFVSSLGYHLKCIRILRRYQYSMFTLCIDIMFGYLLNARLIQQWLLLQIWII